MAVDSPHHFLHLPQPVASVPPVIQGLLGQGGDVLLEPEAGVRGQGSEEDMVPHGEVLHLGRREALHQHHLCDGERTRGKARRRIRAVAGGHANAICQPGVGIPWGGEGGGEWFTARATGWDSGSRVKTLRRVSVRGDGCFTVRPVFFVINRVVLIESHLHCG